MSATAGQHVIVESRALHRRQVRRATLILLSAVIIGPIGFYLSHNAIAIDHAGNLLIAGKALCDRNGGLRKIHLRLRPDRWSFQCNDGALYADVEVLIKDPSTLTN